MSWRDICPMDEKIKFIGLIKSGNFSITELCEKFGISRKTGYKWINRYNADGPSGLNERTRARITQEYRTPEEIQTAIVKLREERSLWGPKKIKAYLERENPEIIWPAASTIGDILKGHSLVGKRKIRQCVPPYTQPFADCNAPNDVWSADFKGQFRLGNTKYCYPLTITDNYSRYILACDGYLNPTLENVKKSFEKVFIEYGVPNAIKTDNGTPFASTGAGGLSQLSMWWIKLGIYPERIDAGHPEQNGRHERMHRTLKAHTALPAEQTLSLQNKVFENFIRDFNYERPHEAINNKVPAILYRRSICEYPTVIPEMMYEERYTIRKVRSNGEIKWKGGLIYISEMLYKEPVGLIEVNDGIWEVMFGCLRLGVIDETKGKIKRYG